MNMKVLTYLVGTSVAGIVLCLGMTIFTAVKQRQAVVVEAPSSIPTPAAIR